jgi:hypothetical protein
MCLDCLTRFETYLKADDKFEEYEKRKNYESIVSFFKDAEKEKEIIKSSLDAIEYVEEDGSREIWNFQNKKSFLEKIDNDFAKLKEDMFEPYKEFSKEQNLNN